MWALVCISVCVNVAGDDFCELKAGVGDCAKNAVWMFRNCWKSCVQCQAQAGQFHSSLRYLIPSSDYVLARF